MKYRYIEKSANSDDTWTYELEGPFPVKFADFFKEILECEDSFRITFGAANAEYGGWLGNRLEIYKDTGSGKCFWEKREPEDWYEQIKEMNVISCWANGGWGQMLYIVKFGEDKNGQNDLS